MLRFNTVPVEAVGTERAEGVVVAATEVRVDAAGARRAGADDRRLQDLRIHREDRAQRRIARQQPEGVGEPVDQPILAAVVPVENVCTSAKNRASWSTVLGLGAVLRT